ncbi:MAG: type ISP restriction/modification enzyme [Beijerinckiaceae bacterium]|nr:type ISP restriction/modification enzyme [Beijerinckiaceae bacterium]
MSQLAITKYLNDLDVLRSVSGTGREGVVSEAFKDLLKSYAKTRDLIFINQYELPKQDGKSRWIDGALVYDLRLPFGYWEAKDEEDNLDKEIAAKFRRGYPRDNIIFEDSATAVLIQNGNEVTRCPVQDVARLEHLLNLFFSYERQEIRDFRRAVVQFQTDLPEVLKALREMIDKASADNAAFRRATVKFLKHARETINPTVTADDVREMLIQHILTEEIFAKVFDNDDFHRQNNVAKELYTLEELFFTGALKKNTLKGLEPYYNAIRATAHQIKSHSEKQTFLKVIYEGFYKVYNKKAADRLGVVYTPQEIVRFMIESADWLCQKHFGKALIDRDVEILDPATGTGTFICELLEHFRGQKQKLAHKYKEELHANEVAILPYYVANLNIEATYAAIMGQYADYPNLCFVDTLDNVHGLGIRSGHQHDLFGAVSEENIERIKRQNRRKISVVIGNPPYNAWQENFNQRNANRAYQRIDERIAATYIRKGTAQNKNSVYDMYTRFFRWASDRLHDDGILAFITNRNFIEKAAFDGFRRDIAEEFNEIFIVDLGGDIRANPKLSGTKHNVFGIQTGVSIAFLVKRKLQKEVAIHYTRRPEDEVASDKLSWLSSSESITHLDFELVRPDAKHNWVNKTENDWDSLLPIVTKATKAGRSGTRNQAIFQTFSRGLGTYRDEWVYSLDRVTLENKAALLVETYELTRNKRSYIGRNSIKWDRELEKYLGKGIQKAFNPNSVTSAAFRPFVKQWVYFDKHFNGMVYQLPSFFRENCPNKVIGFLGIASSHEIAVHAVDRIYDLGLLKQGNGGTQGVPLYRFNREGDRIENITDWAINKFVAHYGKYGALPSPAVQGKRKAEKREISKDGIFHYVYAVLHDPLYREKYAQNLKREFPRIPFYPDFWRWADWGEKLMTLHIGYESVEPWPLTRTDGVDEKSRKAALTPKNILRSDHESGIITLDSETQLSGVPASAWTYRLGNRTALDWILDQHKEKTPKDPTIREKFNTYRFADHKEKVVDLLMRVTRVSVETMEIVEEMRAASK